MVNNKTYNNVVNTLLRLAENHRQIHTTSVGDIFDIDLSKVTKFPLLHINPTSVSTGDSQLTYNFQILTNSYRLYRNVEAQFKTIFSRC
jgi:hypothetical protein